MKCLICRSEAIQVKPIFKKFDRGDDIIRFPLDVPVFTNCLGLDSSCERMTVPQSHFDFH